MSSNSSTSKCSSSSRCRGDHASIMEAQRPSPPSSLNRMHSASPRRRNGNNFHPLSTPNSFENDFPRLLFLDENCEDEEIDTFKIQRKLLRRRYVRREQNKKKRQREMENARQMALETEKHQIQPILSTKEPTAVQYTDSEDSMEQAEQKQRLLLSPSFRMSCGMTSPCYSPAFNLPCFSPLRPTKRQNTRVTH
ncbi:unnamed protein product [Cylindrotheca closterium]|uniref:Uncharacterized protein n=1 Tax=Cylindrotheca closterium TaxID=2856 RepID=A0AAD2JH08_9STRA|nr:unnamed protein product [Cylindrotheca closterium]